MIDRKQERTERFNRKKKVKNYKPTGNSSRTKEFRRKEKNIHHIDLGE